MQRRIPTPSLREVTWAFAWAKILPQVVFSPMVKHFHNSPGGWRCSHFVWGSLLITCSLLSLGISLESMWHQIRQRAMKSVCELDWHVPINSSHEWLWCPGATGCGGHGESAIRSRLKYSMRGSQSSHKSSLTKLEVDILMVWFKNKSRVHGSKGNSISHSSANTTA